jgi:cytoskeletal protein RodZ
MLTPKDNGSSEDSVSPPSSSHNSEPAGVPSGQPLSQTLREARERKKMSLQEVATLTHIPLNYLQLLEGEGNQSVVPDSLYLMASLRSYVDFLGLDAGAVVTQFIAELDAESPVQEKAGREEHTNPFLRYFPQQWSRTLLGTLLVVLTLGLLAVIGHYSGLPQRPQPPEHLSTPPSASVPLPPVTPPTASSQESPVPLPAVSPPVAAVPQAEPSAAPVPRLQAPVVASPSPRQKSPNNAPHRLRVRATAKTWFQITVDERPMKRLFLRPGQTLEWRAEKGFTLSMGDAGAVKLSLDGHALSPVGKAGERALNIRLPSPRKSQGQEARNTARPRGTKPR